MKYELIIKVTEEKRAVIEANSEEDALRMYENGEVNFKEIDGSLSSDKVYITKINDLNLMEQILLNAEKECKSMSLNDLIEACIKNHSLSTQTVFNHKSRKETITKLCLYSLGILLLQYDREDLLKFMMSRAHWYKAKANPEDYVNKLLIDVKENHIYKNGISIKPILYLLATVESW